MGEKLVGKPRDSSTGKEISHSIIPQRWRFLRQLLLSACPRKPQQFCLCQERIKPETRALRAAFSPTHCTPRRETGQTRPQLNSSPVPTFSEAADVVSTARIEQGPPNSLYLSLGEWPRLPLTARIERCTTILLLPSTLVISSGMGTD